MPQLLQIQSADVFVKIQAAGYLLGPYMYNVSFNTVESRVPKK
jgi:hypothetical protein